MGTQIYVPIIIYVYIIIMNIPVLKYLSSDNKLCTYSPIVTFLLLSQEIENSSSSNRYGSNHIHS